MATKKKTKKAAAKKPRKSRKLTASQQKISMLNERAFQLAYQAGKQGQDALTPRGYYKKAKDYVYK